MRCLFCRIVRGAGLHTLFSFAVGAAQPLLPLHLFVTRL